MTNEMLSDFVYQQMKEIFDDNSKTIIQNLEAAAAPDLLDAKTIKLLSKTMFISSQYAVLYTLHFLNNNGILTLPADNQPFLWTRDRIPPTPPEPPGPTSHE